MAFTETFEVRPGLITRTIQFGDERVETTISDVSKLGQNKMGWSRWWRSFLRGALPGLVGPSKGTLNVVDLFCGSGGLALGVRQGALAMGYGMEIKAAVDVDRDALRVYAYNLNPELTLGEDVARLTSFQVRGAGRDAEFAYLPKIVHPQMKDLVGKVDMVIAGPPCEGHSNLNNRTRRDDPRNLLYVEAVATTVALQPRAVIIENVPDVVNDAGSVVETAIGLLQKAGYTIQTGVLSAYDLGLPQTRKRFFLVATKDAHGPLSLADVEAVIGSRATTDLRWAIGDLMSEKEENDPIMGATVEMAPETVDRIAYLFKHDLHDLPDHMRPDCHKDGNTYGSVYGRLKWSEPSGTITTGFVTMGRGRYVHPERPRTLTPREGARIQGFPDSFKFRRDSNDMPAKKMLVKWIGDAVPPILGYAAALAALAPAPVHEEKTDLVEPSAATTARMKAVRQSNTAPEAALRALLKEAGIRFEANKRGLPGTPDFVFRKQMLALFVHGCFWHRHEGCALATTPKTNLQFWEEKFAANKRRDMRNLSALRKTGWATATIWQCDMERDPAAVMQRVRHLLANPPKPVPRARAAAKRPKATSERKPTSGTRGPTTKVAALPTRKSRLPAKRT